MKVKKIQVNEYPPESFYSEEDGFVWDMLIFDQDEEPKEDIIAYCKCIYAACKLAPQMLVYGTEACWKVDKREYGPAYYSQKDYPEVRGEKQDLEGAVQRFWAEFDKKAEEHMRSLYQATYQPAGELEWHFGLTILLGWTKKDKCYNIESSCPTGKNIHNGSYRLRAKQPIDFSKHMGSRNITKLQGRFLEEYEKERGYANLIQVIEVDEIQSAPMYTEEEYAELNKQMSQGPFMGRLMHPDIFGDNPDLYGPMTQEQMNKMLDNQ